MATKVLEITDNSPPIEGKTRVPRKSRTKPLTREGVKATLTRIINYHRDMAVSGRIRDPEVEKARRESARIAIYACSVFLSALREEQMDEIEKRLLILEGDQK